MSHNLETLETSTPPTARRTAARTPIRERERNLRQQVADLEAEIAAMRSSETWRVGSAVVRPLSRAARLLCPGNPGGELSVKTTPTATAPAAPAAEFSVEFRGGAAEFRRKVSAQRRVAVVASWGSNNRHLFGYQAAQLAALARNNWTVIFAHASTRNKTLLASAADIAGVDCLIKRPNDGYDFGSWATGLRLLLEQSTDIDDVLLINDSNFGTIDQIEGLATTPERQFICATDSYDHTHHAQSYLTLFGREPVLSGALTQFLEGSEEWSSRELAIENGELRLTKFMRDAGFDLYPLSPYEQVAETWLRDIPATLNDLKDVYDGLGLGATGAAGYRAHAEQLARAAERVMGNGTVNPTHMFWRTLVTGFGHSMVKKALLAHNPARVGDLMLAWHTGVLNEVAPATQLREVAANGGNPMLMFNSGRDH